MLNAMQGKGHVTEMTACGQWRLVREIGRGAYGTVHLAVGPGSERAAVKVCRRDAIGDERYGRELRGAKLYSSIPPQEGLVRMRELVETEWGFYTVMDLADDEFEGLQEQSDSYRPKTLARVIEGEKALPLKECVSLALSLAKGLAALQRRHLLHRDIKPGNVLYVGGRPVLSDPGLLVEESEAASLVGTPGYVPPEKFTDAASDIYSLGLTLKAASFGRQIEDLDKGPAMEADAGAPYFPTWWRILNKATNPVPSRRYQSAKALVRDLAVLRIKMAMASPVRSWMLYVSIGGALSFAVAYLFVSQAKREALDAVAETKANMSTELADMVGMQGSLRKERERTERNAFWDSYSHTGGYSHDGELIESATRDIAEIRVVDKAKADNLQLILDKIIELAAKEKTLDQKIDELREKAKEKTAKGLDDGEEYFQAQKLHTEREELHKTIQNTATELDAIEKDYLERINRDWFWDLHNSKTCSLDSEFVMDCMKRSISIEEAKLKVDDNLSQERKKELQEWYLEHFESFVKDNDSLALARREFTHLLKLADEKGQNGLDDSAELIRVRCLFFSNNFYYDHLKNTTHLDWLLKSSFSDPVKFDYGFYDIRKFGLELEFYMDLIKREIGLILMEDKALGTEIQESFNKLRKLLAKESSLQRDIDMLFQKAKEKTRKGLDDKEEFLQAQKTAKDAERLHEKKLEPLADKLYDRICEHNPKKSRWDDLYTYREWVLDLDPELIKQGIAKVSTFSKENAEKLQSQLDMLAEGNTKVLPLQREIDLLRKKAREKLQKGKDDTEEYLQAKKIYDKEWEICNREIKNQVEISILSDFASDVRRGQVTPDRWGKEDSNGLWHVHLRKKGGQR